MDEAFEKLLANRLPTIHKNLKTKDPVAWRRILSEQWQHNIKRSFQWEGNGRVWPVILSNVTHNVDVVRLHEDEIRSVFEDSVMPRIIDLIKRQIEQVKRVHGGKGPRIILPVGGFGRCPYVVSRLREEFEGIGVASKNSKNGRKKKQKLDCPVIEVHSKTGEMPWTAVCRGACQFGMRAQMNTRLVKSRSSRISVGFIQNEPGSAEEGGIWMPDFDCYMIPNFMRWVVKKVHLINPLSPVSFLSCFSNSFAREQGDLICTDQKSTIAMYLAFDRAAKGTHTERSIFYACDADSPPERFEGKDAFREYGLMTISATKPIEQLLIEDSDSGGRRVFEYNLQIEIVGGSIQITATSGSPHDGGKEVGKLVLPKLDTM